MSANLVTQHSKLDLSGGRAPQWLDQTLSAMVATWHGLRLGSEWITRMTPPDLCLARDPFRNAALNRVVHEQPHGTYHGSSQPRPGHALRGTASLPASAGSSNPGLFNPLPHPGRGRLLPHDPKPPMAQARLDSSVASACEPSTPTSSITQALVLAPKLSPGLLQQMANSKPRSFEPGEVTLEPCATAPKTNKQTRTTTRRVFNAATHPRQKPSSRRMPAITSRSANMASDLWVDRHVDQVTKNLVQMKGNPTAKNSTAASASQSQKRPLEMAPYARMASQLFQPLSLKKQWASSLQGQRADKSLLLTLHSTAQSHRGDPPNPARAQPDGRRPSREVPTGLGPGDGPPAWRDTPTDPSLAPISCPSREEKPVAAAQMQNVDAYQRSYLDGPDPSGATTPARDSPPLSPGPQPAQGGRNNNPPEVTVGQLPQPAQGGRNRAPLLAMNADPPQLGSPATTPTGEDLSLLADKIQQILEQEARRHGLDI